MNIEELDYKDKVILVTGGVGSIGSVLIKTLLDYDPRIIRVLDINEAGLFEMGETMGYKKKIRILIGDVRDEKRLRMAMENVDIVFHTAAMKHVPISEYNPFEAVKTNILGTQNIVSAALEMEVEHVITISTDKATAPLNVMGASKLLAERLTIAANLYRGHKKTKLSCVRFGNVLGSRGSVLPVFLKQLESNNEIKITDPKMTRFVMRIEEAVKLVIETAKQSKGGEIFILKMPSLSTGKLAEVVTKLYSQKNKVDPNKIKKVIIGRREGEKIHEHLIIEEEFYNSKVYEMQNGFVILPLLICEQLKWVEEYYRSKFNLIEKFLPEFSSSQIDLMNESQIKDLLKEFI